MFGIDVSSLSMVRSCPLWHCLEHNVILLLNCCLLQVQKLGGYHSYFGCYHCRLTGENLCNHVHYPVPQQLIEKNKQLKPRKAKRIKKQARQVTKLWSINFCIYLQGNLLLLPFLFFIPICPYLSFIIPCNILTYPHFSSLPLTSADLSLFILVILFIFTYLFVHNVINFIFVYHSKNMA